MSHKPFFLKDHIFTSGEWEMADSVGPSLIFGAPEVQRFYYEEVVDSTVQDSNLVLTNLGLFGLPQFIQNLTSNDHLKFKVLQVPKYLDPTLVSDFRERLQEASLALKKCGLLREAAEISEVEKGLVTPSGQSRQQLMAALYYGLRKFGRFQAAFETFPEAREFLKECGSAFFTLNPNQILGQRNRTTAGDGLLCKVRGLDEESGRLFLDRLEAVSRAIPCEHSPAALIEVCSAVLELSDSKKGVIVECGVFKGGSTAKLSLAAAIRNRRLLAFDSFRGLPDHDEQGPNLLFPVGAYYGSRREVEANLRFGESSIVELKEGHFEDTLSDFKDDVALAFLDVDLASSTRLCLRAIWPRLCHGGMIYSHDGHFPEVRQIFEDFAFWKELGESSPPTVELIAGLLRIRR